MLDYAALHEQLRREKNMDLDRVVDIRGMPMDNEIKPLVAALNLRGYRTTASCGGHPISRFVLGLKNNPEYKHEIVSADRNFVFYRTTLPDGSTGRNSHFNGPWVDVDIDDQQRQKLVGTIIRHNESFPVKWFLKFFKEGSKRLQVQPAYHTLESMQEDSLRLAEEIYNEA